MIIKTPPTIVVNIDLKIFRPNVCLEPWSGLHFCHRRFLRLVKNSRNLLNNSDVCRFAGEISEFFGDIGFFHEYRNLINCLDDIDCISIDGLRERPFTHQFIQDYPTVRIKPYFRDIFSEYYIDILYNYLFYNE